MLGQGLAGPRIARSPSQATYLSGFIFSHRGLGKQRDQGRVRKPVSRAPCHPDTSQTSRAWVLQFVLAPLGGRMEPAREGWPEASGLQLPL